MNRHVLNVRTAVRGTLAVGILIFAWYAAARVASGAADGPLLAVVSACLLIVLLVALRRKESRT